jgi:hypothetical protein
MNKPKQERRNEARHRGLKGARIVFKSHKTLIDRRKRLCNYLEQFKRELSIYLRIPEIPPALLGRRCVAILLIWSVLLGAVLGRFFKVLVLVPACAFVLAAVL